MLFFNLLQADAPELAQSLNADSLSVKTGAVLGALKDRQANELLDSLGEQALQFGLKVLAALAIYVIGAWIISLVRKAIRRGFTRKKAEPTLSTFVDSLVNIAGWVILIIITVSTLGINTTSLAALLAAGGMAIGMALSGTVQNFAGGLMLLIFKPFKAGDFIEAQGFAGVVKEINIVSTKLITVDNRQIILPNGALSNGNINNVSAFELRRVDVSVSVSYGSDAQAVKAALLEIVASNPIFLDSGTPGAADPFVAISKLSDSSVEFTLRAWTAAKDYWTAYFWLNENIYTQLPGKYGINFPFKQLDVHVIN